MNLAYLEFIGAIEFNRSPVAVNPAISFDKPIGKKSRKQFTYIDTRQNKSISDLEDELERKKEEQKEAITYVYNELAELAREHNSRLREGYIDYCFENVKLPAAIIRSGGKFKDATDNYALGDILFCNDEIVLFMDWITYDFIVALGKKYNTNICINKGILMRDPMEVHIDMSQYL